VKHYKNRGTYHHRPHFYHNFLPDSETVKVMHSITDRCTVILYCPSDTVDSVEL